MDAPPLDLPPQRPVVVIVSTRPASAAPPIAVPPADESQGRWQGIKFGPAFVPLLVIAIIVVMAYDLYLVGIGLQ